MTDRREYTGKERRGRSDKFTTAEDIRTLREKAKAKLEEYEMYEGVGIKSFVTCASAILCIIGAYIGMHIDNSVLLWTGVAGTIASVTFGEKWIRAAKKQALEQFKKDPNRHLAEYLLS